MSTSQEIVRTYNLALIGFGGVNRALAELICDHAGHVEQDLGFSLRIVAITDIALGSWVNDEGIDVATALSIPRNGSFADFPGGSRAVDNESVIRHCSADIVVEATFTNPIDGEPASSHVRWALESGKHVATTNKGPVALHGAELGALAASRDVRFEFEGAVMSGTPVVRFTDHMLAGLTVSAFEGILNGTSNYVLGRMECGLSLSEAVSEAQRLGYAEADPSADIGGSDVRLKVVILANQVLGAHLKVDDVETTGIDTVDASDIVAASGEGKTWKLIGSAARAPGGQVSAEVKPVALDNAHPLAGISGATNAVSFDTDLLGAVTVSGPGAGRTETAYALLSDIVSIDEYMTRKEALHV